MFKNILALLFVSMFVFPIGVSAQNAQPSATDIQKQLNESNAALRKAVEEKRAAEAAAAKCDKPGAARVQAITQVNRTGKAYRNSPLSKTHSTEIQAMIEKALGDIRTAADCCEKMASAVKGLQDGLADLEKRVENLEELGATHTNQIGDHEKRITKLESRYTSSAFSEKGSMVNFYGRVFLDYSLSAPMRYRTVLNIGRAGASFVLTKHMVKKTDNVEDRKEGWLLIGAEGFIGLTLQPGSSPVYAGGGFIAGQWRNGVYLGISAQSLVVNMSPSDCWAVIPAGLLGWKFPGPASDKKIGLFLEGLVGPAITWEYLPVDQPVKVSVNPWVSVRVGMTLF